MTTLTANALKTKGLAAVREALGDGMDGAVISVRGKPEYVVMTMASYNRFRECELEAALAETRRDLAAGRFHVETVEEHLARVAP